MDRRQAMSGRPWWVRPHCTGRSTPVKSPRPGTKEPPGKHYTDGVKERKMSEGATEGKRYEAQRSRSRGEKAGG